MMLKEKIREEVEIQKQKFLTLSNVTSGDLELAVDDVAYRSICSAGLDQTFVKGFYNQEKFCGLMVKRVHPDFGGYFNVQIQSKNTGVAEIMCPRCWEAVSVDADDVEWG